MRSRLILKIAGEKERQPTSTEPWNDSLYEDQYSVPLPPIQVTRNKAITCSYTLWDTASLDTGFLATAVKNLWVVLSFNARKAIPHNTGLINNVATVISTICKCNQKGLHAVQFGNNWMKKIPRTAKIGRGRSRSPIWLSEECFNSIICKFDKHVVLLLINIT